MNDVAIKPSYQTLSVEQKKTLKEIVNSSLINGLNQKDFEDILIVFDRVIRRLEEV